VKKTPDPDGPYAESAERFLLLVAASRMSKARLMKETGISSPRLVFYENGTHAPRDAFAKNSEFSRIAAAFKLLPSALLAWWAGDDDRLLPGYLADEIEKFRVLPPREQMAQWRLLGWQRPQGKQPKLRPAPPRADR